VAQDVIISEYTAVPWTASFVSGIVEAGEIIEALRDRIIGRVSLEKIKDYDGNVIVDINQEIHENWRARFSCRYRAGEDPVGADCESKRGVCVMCYGRNLAFGPSGRTRRSYWRHRAQSIGEPGTQLNDAYLPYRWYGVASFGTVPPRCQNYRNSPIHWTADGEVQDRRPGGDESPRLDRGGRRQEPERERYAVVYGAKLKVNEGDQVKLGDVLVEWDPYTFAILTEIGAPRSSRTCRKVSRSTRSGRSHRPVTSCGCRLTG